MKVDRRELEASPLYAEELGIELGRADDGEYFKWFLASILFGARISQTIASNTYAAFARRRLLEPERILEAGRPFLIHTIMAEGGYVRYDGRKSTQILRDCETLIAEYGGSLQQLHDVSADPRDLEDRLLAFFGIGPVTVNIFLRELRPYWRQADPEPLPAIRDVAARLCIDLDADDRKSIIFARVEAGLLRLRRRPK